MADEDHTPERPFDVKAYKRQWYLENKERLRERQRETNLRYYERNKKKRQAKSREWKAANLEKIKADRATYYVANKERERAQNKAWAAANPERLKKIKSECDRRWREENAETLKTQRRTPEFKERINARQRRRYATDLNYRLRMVLRAIFTQSLRLQNTAKTTSVSKLIGCTVDELKVHLEAQFQPGMSWENHGEWEIDHIRPCASFDLTDPEQQKVCFHWSNLQPLWKLDNRQKTNRLDWKAE